MEQNAIEERTSALEYVVVERDELRDAELRGCEYGEVNVSLIFVDAGPGEGPRLHRHAYYRWLITTSVSAYIAA
jgi:hypothetical protein